MKVLVTYLTETGNTEKLARAIHEAIEVEADLMPIKEAENVEGYDVIFCGFPVQAHSVPMAAQHFIKGLPPDKKLAIFTTHGSLRGGQLAVTATEHAVSLASRTKVLGTMGCRGKVKPSLIDALMNKPEHRAWAQEAMSAARHPDEADLEDGRDFARKMMAKAASM
jgi:flavodoxin